MHYCDQCANEIDIAALDKRGKLWLLIGGVVCLVWWIKEKTSVKEEKCIDLQKGIKNLYKDHTVTQIKVVFDFWGGYYTKMEKEINNITGTDKETECIVIECQKMAPFTKQWDSPKILWVYVTIIVTVLHVTRKQQSISVTHIVVKESTNKDSIIIIIIIILLLLLLLHYDFDKNISIFLHLFE